MSEPVVDPVYVGYVRRYQPSEYDEPRFLAVLHRLGAVRGTLICPHYHVTPEEADTCADQLARAANAGARS